MSERVSVVIDQLTDPRRKLDHTGRKALTFITAISGYARNRRGSSRKSASPLEAAPSIQALRHLANAAQLTEHSQQYVLAIHAQEHGWTQPVLFPSDCAQFTDQPLLGVCWDMPLKFRGLGIWGSGHQLFTEDEAHTVAGTEDTYQFTRTVRLDDPYLLQYPITDAERARRANELFLRTALLAYFGRKKSETDNWIFQEILNATSFEGLYETLQFSDSDLCAYLVQLMVPLPCSLMRYQAGSSSGTWEPTFTKTKSGSRILKKLIDRAIVPTQAIFRVVSCLTEGQVKRLCHRIYRHRLTEAQFYFEALSELLLQCNKTGAPESNPEALELHGLEKDYTVGPYDGSRIFFRSQVSERGWFLVDRVGRVDQEGADDIILAEVEQKRKAKEAARARDRPPSGRRAENERPTSSKSERGAPSDTKHERRHKDNKIEGDADSRKKRDASEPDKKSRPSSRRRSVEVEKSRSHGSRPQSRGETERKREEGPKSRGDPRENHLKSREGRSEPTADRHELRQDTKRTGEESIELSKDTHRVAETSEDCSVIEEPIAVPTTQVNFSRPLRSKASVPSVIVADAGEIESRDSDLEILEHPHLRAVTLAAPTVGHSEPRSVSANSESSSMKDTLIVPSHLSSGSPSSLPKETPTETSSIGGTVPLAHHGDAWSPLSERDETPYAKALLPRPTGVGVPAASESDMPALSSPAESPTETQREVSSSSDLRDNPTIGLENVSAPFPSATPIRRAAEDGGRSVDIDQPGVAGQPGEVCDKSDTQSLRHLLDHLPETSPINRPTLPPLHASKGMPMKSDSHLRRPIIGDKGPIATSAPIMTSASLAGSTPTESSPQRTSQAPGLATVPIIPSAPTVASAAPVTKAPTLSPALPVSSACPAPPGGVAGRTVAPLPQPPRAYGEPTRPLTPTMPSAVIMPSASIIPSAPRVSSAHVVPLPLIAPSSFMVASAPITTSGQGPTSAPILTPNVTTPRWHQNTDRVMEELFNGSVLEEMGDAEQQDIRKVLRRHAIRGRNLVNCWEFVEEHFQMLGLRFGHILALKEAIAEYRSDAKRWVDRG